jgi:phosphate transport system permease protein
VSETREREPVLAPGTRSAARRRVGARRSSHFAQGEPMIWLTGGSLVVASLMIIGLLLLVFYQGFSTFWPSRLQEVHSHDGRVLLGELRSTETFRPTAADLAGLDPDARALAERELAESGGIGSRRLLRTGNFELTDTHFQWVSDHEIDEIAYPEWATTVERLYGGRFYGLPFAFRIDGDVVSESPEEIWELFDVHHPESRDRFAERQDLEEHVGGRLKMRVERARLAIREAELEHGEGSVQHQLAIRESEVVEGEVAQSHEEIRAQLDELEAENARYEVVFVTSDGQEKTMTLSEIVRAYPANRLGLGGRIGVYLSRWWEYLADDPRYMNSEGGVFPAIFGTVAMTFLMSILVVPFGVLAALYLREYAKQGLIVSTVRIAVNNLAGVPSIVFGVFGLGFFCYIIGASIDQLLFEASLPNPTYGKGGLLWASLTLALLTLPVVVVATEEALAAVPNSMREGSYACGATKWQTIRRIVLPRAAPGIMTGMILAIARGAGEVAPLMLVGAVKFAPALPVDGVAPFVHPERSFMHLGFHIFDLGFQSQNSEAAKPMVYTTTLLLVAIVVLLNLMAVWIRARLRRKFQGTYI